jgi:transposase
MIQLTTQLDRELPGVGAGIAGLFDTGIGRPVIGRIHRSDASGKLGTNEVGVDFFADDGLRLEHPRAERLVEVVAAAAVAVDA